jgi:hypothetical protein
MKISWTGQIKHIVETTLKPVNKTLDDFKVKGHTRNKIFEWNKNIVAIAVSIDFEDTNWNELSEN